MRASSKLISLYILFILIVSFFYSSQVKSAQFDNPVLNQNLNRIKTAWGRADFIIVGEILSVGKPHHFQKVTYKILDVVYGRLPKKDMKQIIVEHYLRSRSRLENPDPKKLELSPSLFSPGNHLIAMIMIYKESFDNIDQNFGTFPATEQNVKAIQQLLKGNLSNEQKISAVRQLISLQALD